jgi:hypothetical protein
MRLSKRFLVGGLLLVVLLAGYYYDGRGGERPDDKYYANIRLVLGESYVDYHPLASEVYRSDFRFLAGQFERLLGLRLNLSKVVWDWVMPRVDNYTELIGVLANEFPNDDYDATVLYAGRIIGKDGHKGAGGCDHWADGAEAGYFGYNNPNKSRCGYVALEMTAKLRLYPGYPERAFGHELAHILGGRHENASSFCYGLYCGLGIGHRATLVAGSGFDRWLFREWEISDENLVYIRMTLSRWVRRES